MKTKKNQKRTKKESAIDIRRKAVNMLLEDNTKGDITPADIRNAFSLVFDAIEQEAKHG